MANLTPEWGRIRQITPTRFVVELFIGEEQVGHKIFSFNPEIEFAQWDAWLDAFDYLSHIVNPVPKEYPRPMNWEGYHPDFKEDPNEP